MNIAVVGAGYAGLSVCWHLLQLGAFVTLFDEVGIGGGASGASTGLLHPYSAKLVRRTARADEAMQVASELIDVAQSALGKRVALRSGIVRFAMNEAQQLAFLQPFPDARRIDEEEIQSRFPGVVATEGLWIERGMTVFSDLYLQGLWLACKQNGAKLEACRVENPSELSGFDVVVLASGADLLRMNLPVNAKYGQALVCRFPSELEKLPCSLIGQGHLSLMPDPDLCLLGSTYEREPDLNQALRLREQIGAFYPPARSFEIVDIKGGVRITPKGGYLPLIEQISSSVWVFSGLGSRGLLYHGLYGRELASRVCPEPKTPIA